MALLLTGATGFVGSSVLDALVSHGHSVLALVRTEAKAEAVRARGAEAVVGDLTDLDLLARLVAESDGVVHTAAPSDGSAAGFDAALVDVVTRELAGTERPFVHTGGIWVFGDADGGVLTETSPKKPETVSGWRIPVEASVRASSIRTTIVAPGIVYGHGRGIPADLVEGDEVRLAGDGSQNWAVIHVDDLAEVYVKAVEAAAEDEYYFVVSDESPTMRAAADAAAHGRPIIDESADESRARLGAAYADALMADQVVSAQHVRDAFGWQATQVSLVDDLASGSYAK